MVPVYKKDSCKIVKLLNLSGLLLRKKEKVTKELHYFRHGFQTSQLTPYLIPSATIIMSKH